MYTRRIIEMKRDISARASGILSLVSKMQESAAKRLVFALNVPRELPEQSAELRSFQRFRSAVKCPR